MLLRRLLFIAVTTSLLCGCLSPRTDHTRFYFLAIPPAAPSTAAVERDKVFLIGLRINSADYLRTKQMIVELGPNQLRLSEENVWEETPQAGFTRVLARRLAQNLPDCQLVPLPTGVTYK
ncbi:MAG TPA: ABC-type transport auxiliary lipoprotein family protein, partial [Candidatus Cybelea sp.]|nr:ABC-type transport auxiliary lipoprotein family protein [Candidatus Cybelea sp.]